MKIKKVNQESELNISVKKVRLPSLKDNVGGMCECEYIDIHSFSYSNGTLHHSFFKDFLRDKDKFYKAIEDEYQPIYGDQSIYSSQGYCDGVIDLIPVVETEDNLETETIYISNNIPFIAVSENKLICLSRINYFIDDFIDSEDFDALCDYIDKELETFQMVINNG